MRVYQPFSLQVESVVQLDEQASHHIARVLRAGAGEAVTLFNGMGGEYEGVIDQVAKRHVFVRITQFIAREAESPIDICLAQGMARGEKMDFIIQKAVELGVKKIVPLFTTRSTVRLDAERSEKRLGHWPSMMISACEQSGRNRLPEIVAPISLAVWLAEVTVDAHKYVLAPDSVSKLPEMSGERPKQVVLLIGPEGGLSPEEAALACNKGFNPLNLGPRILRTETASVTAISLIQLKFGDIG